ncbi:hypothetical protein NL375_26565 [Klebsiella pneumoniae]|nr:hypothetical protein [Klebsiella pneumoniae]
MSGVHDMTETVRYINNWN